MFLRSPKAQISPEGGGGELEAGGGDILKGFTSMFY